ncbi:PREDICTED: poly(A) RNA polymerase GLD2-like isoform X2 [Priapulus caudatus]|uniref:Poly(A) RNA polymerase GLD2-like isoform X2 n=1 Tax=Priapulus caudatus TaxID=37621 RepID=A0ABM1FAG4_PRICU|nr:PREDICTED: poly(A) RNA polymerase GLD2-like isoform X2 [Priapulus caudatus]
MNKFNNLYTAPHFIQPWIVPPLLTNGNQPAYFTGCTDSRLLQPANIDKRLSGLPAGFCLPQNVDYLKLEQALKNAAQLIQPAQPMTPHANYSRSTSYSRSDIDAQFNTQNSAGSLPSSSGAVTPNMTRENLQQYTPGATPSMKNSSKGVKRQLDVGSFSPEGRERSGSKRHVSESDVTVEEAAKRSSSSERILRKVAAPVRVADNSEWGSVSQGIWDFYAAHKQSDKTYQSKMKLRDAIYEVLKEIYPFSGLYIVGSSMSGFSSETSDMDMCLMLSHDEIDQRYEATSILTRLFSAITKCQFVRQPTLIRAKVPILKFVDRVSGTEVDLNVNNSVGIRNTHLLNTYSKMDWRVCPLVLVVKQWAKGHDINDASQKTIASYALVLMIIHYLQYGCVPPVLPCLQKLYPSKFSPDSDVRSLVLNEDAPQWHSKNRESVGALFAGFLEYYSNKFNFSKDAVSVRLGAKVPRSTVVKRRSIKPNPSSQWKCLCIEEPFDYSNAARSVYDEYVFQRIKGVFQNSWRRLNSAKELGSITKLD